MYVCIYIYIHTYRGPNFYLHAVLAQRREVGRPAVIHNVWVSCIYVCVCIYIYIYVYIYIYIYILICVYVCIYIYIHIVGPTSICMPCLPREER